MSQVLKLIWFIVGIFIFLAGCSSVHAHPAVDPKPATKHCDSSPCVPVGRLKGPLNSADSIQELTKFLVESYQEKALRAVILIDSPGGNWQISESLHQIVKHSPVPVVCVVVGNAASGAFWFLQGCQQRFAILQATLMTHQTQFILMREYTFVARDLEEIAQGIRLQNYQMASQIAPALQLTPAELLHIWEKGDWQMNSVEALKAHAIDRIIDDDPKTWTFLKG